MGDEQGAIGLYEEALAGGLREPHRHRAQLQLASSLRVVGRAAEAQGLVADVLEARPHNTAAAHAPRAGPGRPRPGAPGRRRPHPGDARGDDRRDTQAYRRALRAYADELAPVTD